ncbi:MAG: guanylate kinase [Candidatus Omnitrophica bacterium]|nr:guanylate kinase [Candidatus Omnitrophota bacterium]
MKRKKGKVVILSGPSGAGKTTLHDKLLNSPRLKGRLIKSISVTTRPQRAGERHGREYFFVTPKMFLHKRCANHFLESEKVFDHYYGTPRKQVEDSLRLGKSVLLCIDVKGAEDAARCYPDAIKIFIKPPSLEELKKRLQNRGTETSGGMQLRLKIANQELQEAKNYDHVIVNDSLPQAYQKLEEIVFSCLSK